MCMLLSANAPFCQYVCLPIKCTHHPPCTSLRRACKPYCCSGLEAALCVCAKALLIVKWWSVPPRTIDSLKISLLCAACRLPVGCAPEGPIAAP